MGSIHSAVRLLAQPFRKRSSDNIEQSSPQCNPSKKRKTCTSTRNLTGDSDEECRNLQALMKQLPEVIHLKIYDFFLAFRSYEQQYQLDFLNEMIKDLHEDGYGYENPDDVDRISEKIPFERSDLPEKIYVLKDLINFMWDVMEYGYVWIEKRLFYPDGVRKMELFRLLIHNDGEDIDVLYDIDTFRKVAIVYNRNEGHRQLDVSMDELLTRVVNDVVNDSDCFEHLLSELEDDGRNQYYTSLCEQQRSIANEAIVTQPDDFDELRSVLHTKCVNAKVSS